MPPIESFKKNRPDLSTFQKSEEKGFLGRIGDVFKRGASKLESVVERDVNKEQTKVEGIAQTAGLALGTTGEVAFEGIRAITPKRIREVLGGLVGKIAETEPVKNTFVAYMDWADKNPRSAANVEAGFNIASFIPIGKGVGAVTTKTGEQVSKQAPRMASFFEGRLANQQLDEAIRVIKPGLNKAEKVRLLSQGQAEKGWLGSIKTLPTDRDLEVAETVQGIVKANKNPIINIKAVNSEIAKVGKKVDEGLKDVGQIYNNKQLASRLNLAKEDSRVVFGSEKSIENTYDAVIDEFTRIKSSFPNTVAGLRDARVKFDAVMKNKFPKVFDNPAGTDIARYNAINDVRRAVNEYSFDLLPEGNPYRSQLRQLNNLYIAGKNIAQKATSVVDISATQRLMKELRQNVLVYGLTGGIITAGALTGLLTNPILLSGLLVGGSYKIGKKVITSQTLKKTLINILRKGGSLDEVNKNTVRTLIAEIDSYSGVSKSTKEFIDNPKLGLSLEDVSKKTNPVVGQTTDLLAEARKYKTAEEFVKAQGTSKLYNVGDSFEMGRIIENPFKEGVPSVEKAQEINKYLQANKDKYNPKYVKFYHGTAKGLPIEEKGLLPTSATRRRSYQSESGYVYLANTPERAKTFGDLGNMGKSDVYEVVVPLDKLMADLDQLNNIRSTGEKVGNTVGESIVYGGGVRIKGKIEPYAIRKLPDNLKTKSQLTDIWKKANKGKGG